MLIGLIGPEGAGKSLGATILAYHLRVPIVPFAAPLKDMILALGVDRKHVYGKPADKAAPLSIFCGKTARHAMQTLGTEWGRQCIGEDFWRNAWLARVEAGGIADDVRFANEAATIHDRGGLIVRVIRSEKDLDRVPQHASEDFAALPFDVQVINDACVTKFERKLKRAVDKALAARNVPAVAPNAA